MTSLSSIPALPNTNAPKSILQPPPLFSIEATEYDFENYALEHGIPETLDPLPYRKAGSVFATGEEAEPVLTSAKNDPRLRTVVCRHWLRDLCMKGPSCEFLHQYDLSKMPLCRHGDRCKVKDCPFRHISEADRLECVFYSQGFCIHGPFCRYKHVRRDRDCLPPVADFTLGLSQMQAGKDGVQARRPAPKPNEFYKVSLCKHFLQGECPFGDGCHFAHGEHELKKFPRTNAGVCVVATDGNNNADGTGATTGEDDELTDNMFSNNQDTTVDYFRGGNAGGGKPSPILEPESASFFILRAATQRDLAHSTVRKEWYVQKKHARAMNDAFEAGKPVMLFFTVSDSEHIQGAALLTSKAEYREHSARSSSSSGRSSRKRDRSGNTRVKEEDHNGKNYGDEPPLEGEGTGSSSSSSAPFSYRIGCEWYRTTELPISTAVEAAPDLLLPTPSTQYCQDMTPRTGEAVMKAVWNSPLVTLYESFTGDKEPPEDDALLTDFRCPPPIGSGSDDETPWPISPLPGFIFGCNSQTMDECLGRGILGLPSHMKHAASSIRPGSTVFLFNVTDRLLFGIFEALTPAIPNIEPRAFSKNPKATSSPFPIQIRIRVGLECPPLEDTDGVLCDVLRSRVGGRIGPLTHAQSEAVASMLAIQCGAMRYMKEYREGLDKGEAVTAPPIALPPRKIEVVDSSGVKSDGLGK